MTQRIPLDHLTSDQLDQLYEQLDRAEAHADPELHDRLDAALTALGRAETELIALRARGSGDATPLPEHIRPTRHTRSREGPHRPPVGRQSPPTG
jgi:hypothetical protein